MIKKIKQESIKIDVKNGPYTLKNGGYIVPFDPKKEKYMVGIQGQIWGVDLVQLS